MFARLLAAYMHARGTAERPAAALRAASCCSSGALAGVCTPVAAIAAHSNNTPTDDSDLLHAYPCSFEAAYVSDLLPLTSPQVSSIGEYHACAELVLSAEPADGICKQFRVQNAATLPKKRPRALRSTPVDTVLRCEETRLPSHSCIALSEEPLQSCELAFTVAFAVAFDDDVGCTFEPALLGALLAALKLGAGAGTVAETAFDGSIDGGLHEGAWVALRPPRLAGTAPLEVAVARAAVVEALLPLEVVEESAIGAAVDAFVTLLRVARVDLLLPSASPSDAAAADPAAVFADVAEAALSLRALRCVSSAGFAELVFGSLLLVLATQ